MLRRPPIRRTRKGDFTLAISIEERDVLRSLPRQLRELLGGNDPSLARLFPPAYLEDPDLESEYKGLMAGDLRDSHGAALDVMEATVDADRLDEQQLSAWLVGLNQLRLVLGTRLDITEDDIETEVDPQDPRHPAFSLYYYLTYLQDQVVGALSS
ncbi:MAG: DUF2017 family protein [Actinobacteria bacterium]|nr:DUF2017 family protein [Actinomycetota bacterium]